jgi:ribosomal protein S18 acetylase RimI-like enzyme
VLTFETADRFSLAELAAIWRAAYEGYAVPLAFDEEQLGRHIRISGIELGLSLAAMLDGEPVGLSLAARERDEAWIGGFGIAGPHRRLGLATQLMLAHAERLDRAGIVRTRLEVLDGNPAEEVYRRAGFERARELVVLEGDVAHDGDDGLPLGRGDLARAHGRLHAEDPSWRRRLPRLLATLAEFPQAEIVGVRERGAVAAYAVVIDFESQFGLFDAAASDIDSAHKLISAIAAIRPRARVRVVDEPVHTPLARALEHAGFETPFRQWEMTRTNWVC